MQKQDSSLTSSPLLHLLFSLLLCFIANRRCDCLPFVSTEELLTSAVRRSIFSAPHSLRSAPHLVEESIDEGRSPKGEVSVSDSVSIGEVSDSGGEEVTLLDSGFEVINSSAAVKLENGRTDFTLNPSQIPPSLPNPKLHPTPIGSQTPLQNPPFDPKFAINSTSDLDAVYRTNQATTKPRKPPGNSSFNLQEPLEEDDKNPESSLLSSSSSLSSSASSSSNNHSNDQSHFWSKLKKNVAQRMLIRRLQAKQAQKNVTSSTSPSPSPSPLSHGEDEEKRLKADDDAPVLILAVDGRVGGSIEGADSEMEEGEEEEVSGGETVEGLPDHGDKGGTQRQSGDQGEGSSGDEGGVERGDQYSGGDGESPDSTDLDSVDIIGKVKTRKPKGEIASEVEEEEVDVSPMTPRKKIKQAGKKSV